MYEKIAKETRKKVSKLTLEQQKQLSNLYADAVNGLAKTAKLPGQKELTTRWAKDYMKQLTYTRKQLRKSITKQVKDSTIKSAKLGSEGQQLIMTEMFKLGGIEFSNSFSDLFSQVNDNVVKDIISGNLYKDNKSLSRRIWTHSKEFEKDIQYTINQAILEKKSAIELADDLEKFVREPSKRPNNWSKVYPRIANRKADYNAMRLARTSINHAYQNSTVQSSTMNPFIKGIKWHSAMIHGRTCQLCIDRATEDNYGLGEGVFPKDSVPLDHANGLCTMIPYIPQTMEEVGEEIGAWLREEENNNMLDVWYREYGDYFADKMK